MKAERRIAKAVSRAITETLEPRTLLADAGLLKDILAGPDSSISFSSEATNPGVLGNKMIFAAIDDDHGSELWISDGTTAGTTLLADINPGPGSSFANSFTPGNGVLYFSAEADGNDAEVWRTDGTPGGTIKITNAASDVVIRTYNNGNLYYTQFNDPGLFAVNDAGAQSTINASFTSVTLIGNIGAITVFEANDPAIDQSLWATSGGGATLLVDPSDLGTASFTKGTIVNGQLVFGMTWQHNGEELWRTNGTAAGTALIADIRPGVFESSSPNRFVTAGNLAYFVATADGITTQIYRTDGTTTSPVTSFVGPSFGELVNVNGTLFFTEQDGGTPFDLYKLVGGTTPTKINPGSDGGRGAGHLTAVGANVFFAGLDTANHSRLFGSDGSTISLATGDIGTDPRGLTNFNGVLVFQASDDAHGAEVHVMNVDGVTPPQPFSLRLKIHANKKGHTNVIDEGEGLVFEAITTGQSIKKIYWDFGDGKLVYMGKAKKPSHEYPDNFATPNTKVRVKVQAADGTYHNESVDLTVNNLKPKIKLTIPPVFTTWTPMPFFGSVTDPDVTSGKVTSINVEWEDGEHYTLPIDKTGVFHGVKVFTDAPLTGDDLRITVDDGDKVATKKSTVLLSAVTTFLPDNPVGKALGLFGTYIGGTSGDDRIEIKHAPVQPGSGLELMQIIVIATGVELYGDEKQTPIHINTGNGNDRVEIDPLVRNAFIITGGSGKDTLRGGSGDDTILGGGGSDSIDGRGGKNKLKQ